MAVITILLGGVLGMVSAILALLVGKGLFSAMLIWSGVGLLLPLIVILAGRMPRRALVRIRT